MVKVNWNKLDRNKPCAYSTVSPPPLLEVNAYNFETGSTLVVTPLALREDEALELAGVSDSELREQLVRYARPIYHDTKGVWLVAHGTMIDLPLDACERTEQAGDERYDLEMEWIGSIENDRHSSIVLAVNTPVANHLQRKVDEVWGANVQVVGRWRDLFALLNGMVDWVVGVDDA